jgi:cell division protein FtsQ
VDRVPGERRRKIARLLSLALPVVVTLAVLAGAIYAAWRVGVRGDLLRVREVRFHGLARATADELLELSPSGRGDHLLAVDTSAVEAALRRHPWIASAEVSRAFPPALDVTVVEREAAALVRLDALYLVDRGGEVFKRATPGDGLDLPVISGIDRSAWVDRRADVAPLLSAALALLERWADAGLDRRAPVSEIRIDPDYGTTVWAGDDGVEIRLGQGELPEKLARLDRVLAAVEADGQRATVLHLDNRRRPDWVAVRVRPASSGPEEEIAP